ncbi:MAG TPA: choice-of-anchor Q domain-containing protein [Chthoniobacterales bacterium]|nr:choice-of-anchor Q domain-containing protein [Chthoniobacterales bacterium]
MRAFLCLLAGALSCVSVSASTLTVTSTADNGAGSLRAMIAAAAAGDVIQFDPSLNGQVILLATPLNVIRELRIDGPGADQIAISGGNRTRIFSAISPLTLTGLTLKNGLGDGGALRVTRARATAIGCIFTDNAAPNGLGGAINSPGSALELSNCTFLRNTASGFGLGGAFFGPSRIAVTMTDCVFIENSAHDGGAIFADGELNLVRCNFTHNSIPTDGIAGAVYNESPTLMTGCIFSGNSTGDGGEGGALFIGDGIIRDSLIAGNSVGSTSGFVAQGGGIWSFGTLNIQNSTIANNISGAQSQGAGIYNDSVLVLDNTTVSGNSAGASSLGGGIFNEASDGASLSAANTIIARNSAPAGPDIFGTFASRGYNLIGNTGGNTGATGNDLINVDPLLGPLQNNGGPTATMALLLGSVAIDHGDPAFDPNSFAPPMMGDQRGAPRLDNGRLDIGAYEAEPPHFPSIDSLTAPQTVECTSWNGTPASVSVHVSDSRGHPLVIQWIVNNEIKQTDQIPAGQPTSGGQSSYTAIYPDGATAVMVVVNDGQSAPVSQSTSVTIRDTTPPVITSLTASPSVLSPPNHKMVPITISVSATDICDPNPQSRIISVTSNEAGEGQYQITGNLTLNLMSDRNGGGNGRIYTISVEARDASGNTTTKSVVVTVPKGNK